MRYLAMAATVLILGFLTTCGRGGPRQEDLDKLRTLGVSANPISAPPSDAPGASKTVELTVYAAVPIGATATVLPYKDSVPGSGLQLSESDIAIQSGTEQYKDLNGIRLYSVKALVNVPTTAVMQKIGLNGVQVKYGFRITSGSSKENIVGTFMMYPPNAAQLKWQAPTVDISAPVDGATVGAGDIDLTGTATTANGEDLLVGWFVTKGDVSNRRSRSTSWSISDTGTQTVILTAHGTSSRGFAIKTINITTK